MSSHEDAKDAVNGQKKRRIERACDACRRKKVRCDGDQRSQRRCTNCVTNNLECTYQETARRQYSENYVRDLEARLLEMEKLVKKLRGPDSEFVQGVDAASSPEGSSNSLLSPPSSSRSPGPSTPVFRSTLDVDDAYPSDDEMSAQKSLEKSFGKILLNAPPPKAHQYLGKSSGVTFLQTAVDLKKEYEGQSELDGQEHHEPPTAVRRPECWQPHPWIVESFGFPNLKLSFPEDDLMFVLFDLYFQRCNTFFPLLHRPTFFQSVADSLHLQDPNFGFVVLLVCALASRYTEDPRVLLEGADSQYSAGWKWFKQVHDARRSMILEHTTLYDLQIACLSTLYLACTSAPQAAWTMVGTGIRLAQDLGAHRRKMYGKVRTVQNELLKRAFWVLVVMDRGMSSGLGRPLAIQDEDFDVDLPVECDDEYWTNPDPSLAWKQPAGKPSVIAYFNAQIRLNQIHAFTLRTIYAINKSKALLGYVGPSWEQHIVAEIDSALNKWIDTIPDHLRWDPKMENMVFLTQSAALYTRYYGLQISVHRPFLPSSRKQSALSFPSLAICTNAARSCIHVMDVLNSREIFIHVRFPLIDLSAVFVSAVVLLVNTWGRKHSSSKTSSIPEITDVHKAMGILKCYEPYLPVAAILGDVLCGLASFGSIPLPPDSQTTSQKRQRDPEEALGVTPVGTTSQSVGEPRKIAGSNRITSWQQRQPISTSGLPLASHSSSNGVPTTFGSNLPSSSPPVPPIQSPMNAADSWYAMSASSPTPESSMFDIPDFTLPSNIMHPSNAAFPLNPSLPAHLRTPEESHAFSSLLHAHLQPDSVGTATHGSTPELLDYDALTIWSTAPTAFDGQGWETYASMIFNSGGVLDDAGGGFPIGDSGC